MEQQTVATPAENERALTLPGYREEDVITFDEGLVGFPGCKRFVVMENESLSPFRILQCVDHRDVGFLVLDPRILVRNYHRSIPEEAWIALGLPNSTDRLALAISIIGSLPEESTANLQAPLLINYKEMKGRQFILTGSRYGVTEPLVSKKKPLARRRSAGSPTN